MNARQLKLASKEEVRSEFQYDGCMVYRKFINTADDTFTWDESDSSVEADTRNLKWECKLMELELHNYGIIDRASDECMSYKMAKYRMKAEKAAKKEFWNNYDDNKEDMMMENKILSHWMKSQKMTPERFMRDSFDHDEPTIFKDETIKGLNKNIDDKVLKEMNAPRKEKQTVRGTLLPYRRDIKIRQVIKLESLMGYLASITEIREIVYNNTYSTIILKSKKAAHYPEKNVLIALRDILLHGVNQICDYTRVSCFEKAEQMITGPRSSRRNELLTIWSSAPADSVLGKTWNLFPSCEYTELNMVIDWQKPLTSHKNVDATAEYYYDEKLKKDIKEYKMYLTSTEDLVSVS